MSGPWKADNREYSKNLAWIGFRGERASTMMNSSSLSTKPAHCKAYDIGY